MTRETKIGLLVGLAFVIMTGILLSNYLSSTNEPPGASLQLAGNTVRSGLGEPGNDDVAPVLRAPATVTPSSPVVINAELNHRSVPISPTHGNAITPSVPMNPGTLPVDRLREVARQQGEELVPVPNPNNPSTNTPQPINPVQPPTPPVVKTTARNYEAQSGDSLGSIARKMYGSGSKSNRDAIVAANPGMEQNRDLIVAGKTYIIPAITTAAATVKPAIPTPPPVEAPAPEKSIVYVVQPHDTLWSIALDQVGNPNAVAAIEDLNKTVLNGSDQVRPNMKLKLPAKKSTE